MSGIDPGRRPPRRRAWPVACLLLLSCAFATAASAAVTGKVRGRVAATDTGEPIGFADVLLIPADTTQRRAGTLSNADGTFLLEATPGRYTLQIRALSYATRRFDDLVVVAGQLLPFETALTPEAIEQEEIVVEAKALRNNEAAVLAARRKAAAVGDAVSAEQVRRSADKDAAEVLRRVTGLSVADGKYVFVRGLGERYSSTEVDGVRIASPEQNKRVVPLDLLPAALLDNIVVQKTYTADRPGEFGGGDVQVRTKDFPGHRTWQLSISQGASEGATFERRRTYAATRADVVGFGAGARAIPGVVGHMAGDRPLVQSSDPTRGFSRATLAEIGKGFANVWSPTSTRTIPNGSYALTYGDEWKLFGRPVGVIQSWTLSRSFDRQDEAQRFFQGATDTLYDYAVRSDRETVQLGGISGLGVRLSPRHAVHLRGLYTQSADDEVRTYEGPDHNRVEGTTGTWLHHRNTRLMYVQRSVLSGTIEGSHDVARLAGAHLGWKFTRSRARRQQPDRREVTYDRGYYYGDDGELVEYWGLGSTGLREYGDLEDDGWGSTVTAAWPYRLGPLGSGKVTFGWDRQIKRRENFYRRFNFSPAAGSDRTLPPDSLFSPTAFTGAAGTALVTEGTLDIDNYRADQRVAAGYLSLDVPFGRRLRGNVGVRYEHGVQQVRSYDLFDPGRITQQGELDDQDWLPSANLAWSATDALNVRLGASRTLSRPDLNELSPSPSLEYVGGFRVAGNPDLERARIDNYDVRVEAFPGLSEVVAASFFYKRLHQPIEQAIQGGAPPLLVPRNSDRGRNLGVELEARAPLARLWRRLAGLTVNANASLISSEVKLAPSVSRLGSTEHPLQGQADYLANVALAWASRGDGAELAVLFGATGERLRTLGLDPLPDIYEQPSQSLDVTAGFTPFAGARLKVAARNLLDPAVRRLQGEREVSSHRRGRSVSIGISYGQ